MFSKNANLEESDEQDQNIKVYENDEAYMFNEVNSNQNSNQGEEEQIQENENINKENSNKDSNLNNSCNKIDNKNIPNPNQNQNHAIDEEEKNENTIRNKEEEHEEQEETENEEQEENEENEENEDNFPLITLKYVSICQCCKKAFDSTLYIPYLFKCGHFFCKKCINEQFTDDEGIKCPKDGLVAYNLSELKLLNNLISDRNIDSISSRGTFCDIHKGQKITHYIEDTKELICVYCAFARFKKNPKTEIKEIKEKCNEIISEINNIIFENQHNIEMIQSALQDIKKNKENEEKRVSLFFEKISSHIENLKSENLKKVDALFRENAKKLSQKLDLFTKKINQSENVKKMIEDIDKNEASNFIDIVEQHNKLLHETNEQYHSVNLQEYRFNHDDEAKIMKYAGNFGEFKIINKNYSFNGVKEEIDFGFNSLKSNINYNAQISNDFLNNSELQLNTIELRQDQNGKESKNKMLYSSTTQTKNIMNKYSINKPMTPGDYRMSDYRNFQGINLK